MYECRIEMDYMNVWSNVYMCVHAHRPRARRLLSREEARNARKEREGTSKCLQINVAKGYERVGGWVSRR